MTYTHVADNGQNNGGTGDPGPITLTPHAVGNFFLLQVATDSGGSGHTVSSLSATNITWSALTPGFTGTTITGTVRTFIGVATSTSAASTSFTWSGGTPTVFAGIACVEFSSTTGTPVLDGSAAHVDSGGQSAWPNLTATGSGELYWGYCENVGAASSGSTSGYVYNPNIDAGSNGEAYNLSVGPGTVTGPTWADTGQKLGEMVLVKPSGVTDLGFTAVPRTRRLRGRYTRYRRLQWAQSGLPPYFNPVGSTFFQDTPSTVSVTTVASGAPGGDLILLSVASLTDTVSATSLSGGGATWAQIGTNQQNSGFVSQTLWIGTVTSYGAGTITITWSGTAPTAMRVAGQQFSAAGPWSVDTSGANNGAGTTALPSLTPSAGAGELYWVHEIEQTSASPGNSLGFYYFTDAHANIGCWSNICTAAAQAPTLGAESGSVVGIAALIKPGTGVPPGTATLTPAFSITAPDVIQQAIDTLSPAVSISAPASAQQAPATLLPAAAIAAPDVVQLAPATLQAAAAITAPDVIQGVIATLAPGFSITPLATLLAPATLTALTAITDAATQDAPAQLLAGLTVASPDVVQLAIATLGASTSISDVATIGAIATLSASTSVTALATQLAIATLTAAFTIGSPDATLLAPASIVSSYAVTAQGSGGNTAGLNAAFSVTGTATQLAPATLAALVTVSDAAVQDAPATLAAGGTVIAPLAIQLAPATLAAGMSVTTGAVLIPAPATLQAATSLSDTVQQLAIAVLAPGFSLTDLAAQRAIATLAASWSVTAQGGTPVAGAATLAAAWALTGLGFVPAAGPPWEAEPDAVTLRWSVLPGNARWLADAVALRWAARQAGSRWAADGSHGRWRIGP